MLVQKNGQNIRKKGGKIVKSIFEAIIGVDIRDKYSWTGRAAFGQTKIRFSEFKEIISLIFTVCHLANSSYSMSDCEEHITYKVLKHANANTKRSNNRSRSTRDLPPPLELVSTQTTNDDDTPKKIMDLLLRITNKNN